MNRSKRTFLKSLSACALTAGVSRVAGEESAISPSLRNLAAGRPLIGTAVPTNFETLYGDEEKRLLAEHFDCITPENCMKWPSITPDGENYRFEPADRLMDLAAANKQKVVGHTLIFNRDGSQPGFLFLDGGKEAEPKLVWKRIEQHVVKLMERYKGRIDSWDVLNEFVEPEAPGYRVTRLTRVVGADFPERLFKLAAEVDPAAKLVYNDFSVEKPERREAILAFVRSLLDKGCRIDVVGSQSHLELGEHPADLIDATIKEFAALGVKTALTELDIDVVSRRLFWNPKTREEAVKADPYRNGCPPEILEEQATAYGEVMKAVMANRKHVERVTVWGLTDGHSWLNNWPWKRVNHGLLFDRQARPKPAFHTISKILSGG